jgi:stage V sporulation protein B
MVSYMRKAIKSTLIIYFFAIIGALFGYFLRILFAHNLTVREYGLFYAVFGLVSLMFIFRDLGYKTALIRYIPEFLVKKQIGNIKSSFVFVFLVQIVYSLIISSFLFLMANYLAVHYFQDMLAVNIIKVLAIWQIISCPLRVIQPGFRGFQKFFLWSIINNLWIMCVFILAFIFFKLNLGYIAPGLAYMFYPLIFTGIFLPIFLKKVFPQFMTEKTKIDKKLFLKLTKFSIPQMFTNSSSVIMGYIDTIMLTVFAGVSGVGLYHVALPTSRLVLLVGDSLNGFLMPFVSELWTKKHIKHLIEGISLIYKYIAIAIAPVVLIVFAFSDLIIKLLFGNEYIGASMPLKVLVLGLAAFTIFKINSAVLLGINKPTTNAKILFISVIFNVIANVILIYFFKVTGAAIATSLSYFLLMFLSLYCLRNIMKIKLPIFYWIKILIVSIIIVLLTYFIKGIININPFIETGLIILIIGVVYIVTLYLIGILDIAEIKQILIRLNLSKGKAKNK